MGSEMCIRDSGSLGNGPHRLLLYHRHMHIQGESAVMVDNICLQHILERRFAALGRDSPRSLYSQRRISQRGLMPSLP